MKIFKVEYDCRGCGRHCVTTNHNLRYRQHNKDEHLCMRCLIRLQKAPGVFSALPVECHVQALRGAVDHAVAASYLMGVPTSIEVSFSCTVCNKKCKLKWSKMLDRRHRRGEAICGRCLQVEINTSHEALEANRLRTVAMWRDGTLGQACLDGMKIHRRRLQLDEEYAARYKRRCRSVSGEVTIDDQAIRFDSAYELLFIVVVKEQCVAIRRCEYPIAYGDHVYHPDFFLIYPDGIRIIAEVKGYYDNKVAEKQQAAIDYLAETDIADSYVLYDHRKLIADGILNGVGGANMWRQIRRIYKDVAITFSDPKHRRIAEVGYSRYRKETKDQVDHQS